MERCVFTRRFFGSIVLLVACFAATATAAASRPQAPAQQRKPSPTSAPKSIQQNQPPDNSTRSPENSSAAHTQNETDQYVLSHERYEKAVSYSRAGYLLYFVDYALSFAVLFLILRSGIAAKLRDAAESVTDKRWLQCIVFVPLLMLLTEVFEFPVSIYWHSLSLRYEQSIQHWGSWLVDYLKGTALSIGFSIILALVITLAMRKSPRRWWFYFWLAALPIVLFFVFISPWFIDPMFNKFEPLANEHPQMVAAIANLTQRAGVPIPADRMFLMRAAEKTKPSTLTSPASALPSAWSSGTPPSAKPLTDEALFILGHELGHYVLGHVTKGFLFFSFGLLLALYVMFRTLHFALQHWGRRLENLRPRRFGVSRRFVTHLPDSFVYFLTHRQWLQPHAGTCRRCLRTGSNPRHHPQLRGSRRARLSSARRNRSFRSQPVAVHHFLALQPSAVADRLIFAHTYDPWSKGEPPRYVK